MGMDGNHANNTNSHFNRSPCTTSTRGGRKPLQKQHTAYIIQHTTGPQDVWVCSGNGDGWKPWKQHLHTSAPSLKRNSIYSNISTLLFKLLPCTWTLDATNMFEVMKHKLSSKWFLLLPVLPAGALSTRPRSTQYGGRWWHHNSTVASFAQFISCSVTVPVQ
jgi:hypothetical protein